MNTAFGYLLHLLIQGHRGPLRYFLESSIFEIDYGVRDKGSGDTATIDLQTLLEDFLNMSLRSAYSLMKLFSINKQNFQSLGYFSQVSDYWDF
jgi:hypothetical protein